MIKISIVVVEDDEFLLKKISKILTRQISEVYSFSNPKQALEKIPEINPNIIISDINMPEMTGLEMYKRLLEMNLNIPIILASAFSEPEFFVEAIKLKVKNFIVKPIDLDDLIEELKIFETDLINIEDQHKKERLLIIQSKMAEMGGMITNIAHQWKQPLNTISLCTSNIEVEQELGNINDSTNTLTEMISNINNAVSYMNTTINDFQNYLNPEKLESCFYLTDLFEAIEKLTVSQFRSYEIELINEISEDIQLCTFKNELIQAIINIKKNAIDELTKKDLKNKLLKVTVFEKNNIIYITIHDNAGGIPDEIIDKVFEPYFSTKENNGTGIGLYMCKEIIENHLSGKIQVENKTLTHNNIEYKGAKFTIKLNSPKNV